MGIIETAIRLFAEFPGIGARQARRFVYFLLSEKKTLNALIDTLKKLTAESVQCISCQRFFIGQETKEARCSICADTSRNASMLLVVAKDVDLENVERAGAYKGHYFVLGGTIPVLSKTPETAIRLPQLLGRIREGTPQEIILALSTDPEGEETADFIEKTLRKEIKESTVVFSRLGRGLSSGAEIEYADPDTLKNALSGRK